MARRTFVPNVDRPGLISLYYIYVSGLRCVPEFPGLILTLLVFLIVRRGHSHVFGEQPGEIIRIVDAQFGAYLAYFHIRKIEISAGLLNFQLVEIVDRRISRSV